MVMGLGDCRRACAWLILASWIAGCGGEIPVGHDQPDTGVTDRADVGRRPDVRAEGGVTNCPSGTTLCDGRCADTRTDVEHCGACNNPCANDRVCAGGACVPECPPGQMPCGDRCYNLSLDRAHCGACDATCATNESCVAGRCGSVCPAGETRCGDQCVDTLSTGAHCGACGTACAAGESCLNGHCWTPHFTGETGATWELLSPGATPYARGAFSDFTPPGETGFYDTTVTGMQMVLHRYDPEPRHFTDLASLSFPRCVFPGMGPARVGRHLWYLQWNAAIRYSIPDNTWAIVSSWPAAVDNHIRESQTTADDEGHLYALNNASEMVVFDIATLTARRVSIGALGAIGIPVYPNLAWDAATRLVYVTYDYSPGTTVALRTFDPVTNAVTDLPFIPGLRPVDGTLRRRMFCSDRSGHLYAAGDRWSPEPGPIGDAITDDSLYRSRRIWQYDAIQGTWRQLPDVPLRWGGDFSQGMCTVSDDGYLYVSNGSPDPAGAPWLARLRLL
jgi:hypothetical protein